MLFDAPTGVRYQVREVVESYHADRTEWEASKTGEIKSEKEQIRLYVDHFKKKYKSKFADIFGNRNWNTLTAEEETDAAMWSFFLKRISDDEDTGN